MTRTPSLEESLRMFRGDGKDEEGAVRVVVTERAVVPLALLLTPRHTHHPSLFPPQLSSAVDP